MTPAPHFVSEALLDTKKGLQLLVLTLKRNEAGIFPFVARKVPRPDQPR